jgi:hypothetical protein
MSVVRAAGAGAIAGALRLLTAERYKKTFSTNLCNTGP